LVRLDWADDAWHLGFMVDPTQRRRGLAPRLIGAALAQQPARSARVVGECRADNRSSAGAMLAAGMAEAEPVRAGTRRFVYPPPAGEGAGSPAPG
jgi:RimJ/RimL family protein N-acetyltransferase